jgi:hypothetical protein
VLPRHRRPHARRRQAQGAPRLADDFSTLTEGVRGKRAVEGRFVDAVYPTASSRSRSHKHAQALAANPIARHRDLCDARRAGAGDYGDTIQYTYVKGVIDRSKRTCDLTSRSRFSAAAVGR